jgi:hypothetical protein
LNCPRRISVAGDALHSNQEDSRTMHREGWRQTKSERLSVCSNRVLKISIARAIFVVFAGKQPE